MGVSYLKWVDEFSNVLHTQLRIIMAVVFALETLKQSSGNILIEISARF